MKKRYCALFSRYSAKQNDFLAFLLVELSVAAYLQQMFMNGNPILFIKPAGSYRDELVISNAYVSQNDMLPTLGPILGVEVAEDMGINLFDVSIDYTDRVRYHYYTVVENTEQTKTRTYEIKGSSLDFANWSATDEYNEFIYY